MSKSEELRYGAPGENAVHICVDMQRMFAEGTEWKMPWLPRVLPNVVAIASAHPERTMFTRFIPAEKSGQGIGMWRHYYGRWGSMTIDQLGPEMVGLVTELAQFVPKSNAGMGSLYRSAHEFIFVYKNGRAKHINNVELGRFGRSRTNIWQYAGMNSFGKDRDSTLADHPTPKPLALVSDALLDCSKRGGIVLDAFAGSGTTLLAAEKTGRRGYGIELDSHYVDLIIKRCEEVYGLRATHVESGLSFDRIRVKRTERNNGEADSISVRGKKSDGRKPVRKKANTSRKPIGRQKSFSRKEKRFSREER